jgi:hypothetical protein
VPSTAPLVTPPPIATTRSLGDAVTSTLPSVLAYQERLRGALQSETGILLRPYADPTADQVQQLVARHPGVQAVTRNSAGQALRTEVMVVAAARPGDIPPTLVASCTPDCYRVVLYVYPTNTTITAFALPTQVVDIQVLVNSQPEIPEELATLATEIAINDPTVQGMLQLVPDAAMASMSATKTALNSSVCERSRHLCLAPTFVWGSQALWAIVDLTTYQVVGAEWTELGASSRRSLSETTLQNEIVAPFCDTATQVAQGDWQFAYLLTSSDGLEIRDVSFQGRPILASAKIVDWHVAYQAQKGFGYSDAIGCPVFSQAAVVPFAPPTLTTTQNGMLELAITFQSAAWPLPCNYRYTSRYRFHADGTLEISGANEGRGCGTEGIYRPVFRLQTAEPLSNVVVQDRPWQEEQWQEEQPTSEPFAQITTTSGRLTIGADWGAATNAYLYATVAHPTEGSGDLSSIGPCCNATYEQGPEQFIGPPNTPTGPPEALRDQLLALWVVPRLPNKERTQCWADSRLEHGLFVPEVWPCAFSLRLQP